jgi:hypothetical protein
MAEDQQLPNSSAVAHGEPLDLGGTDAFSDVAAVRREHDLDDPDAFDERNGINERCGGRSDLLPEEIAAGGSADPAAQARAVLEDSDLRTELPGAAPSTNLEHRHSDDSL